MEEGENKLNPLVCLSLNIRKIKHKLKFYRRSLDFLPFLTRMTIKELMAAASLLLANHTDFGLDHSYLRTA